MAAFDRYSTSSPVLGIHPQAIHQNPLDRPFSYQAHSFNDAYAWPSRPALRSNATFAGRKRSRDEAAPNLDEPEKLVPVPTVEAAEDDWEYGPGMTLIKKTRGYVAEAGSQSGTWLEEKALAEAAKKQEAAIAAQAQLAQERPSLRSNKSQRLDSANVTSKPVDMNGGGSPARERTPEAPAQPVVDAFTVQLGIGWNRLSEDEGIQAAARGWAKYIENHFPVSNAVIRLESKGLESYLVEGTEGYFLFGENLRQGRLVSVDAERALQNLKSSPPAFDGAETMTAVEAPTVPDVKMHATSGTMDMDMS